VWITVPCYELSGQFKVSLHHGTGFVRGPAFDGIENDLVAVRGMFGSGFFQRVSPCGFEESHEGLEQNPEDDVSSRFRQKIVKIDIRSGHGVEIAFRLPQFVDGLLHGVNLLGRSPFGGQGGDLRLQVGSNLQQVHQTVVLLFEEDFQACGDGIGISATIARRLALGNVHQPSGLQDPHGFTDNRSRDTQALGELSFALKHIPRLIAAHEYVLLKGIHRMVEKTDLFQWFEFHIYMSHILYVTCFVKEKLLNNANQIP